jgi:uncharacterized membrane protein
MQERAIMADTNILTVPYDDRESGPNWRAQRGVNVGQAERWASVFSGAALVAAGLMRGRKEGLLIAGLGGGLLYRGLTGHCPLYNALDTTTAGPEAKGLHVVKSVTIDRSPEELYRYWRDFQNLPRFMNHLEAVENIDSRRSHWVAKGPAGKTVEWNAEIINERENELIAWRSTEEADVENAGSVNFRPAPGGRGTEVKVTLLYNPPGGSLGAQVAKLFGEEPSMQIEDDLRRFKRLMEAGEIPTTEGQPHG